MSVYKFRITFEDYDDISRDIEIKSTQNFEELHNAIQKAIGFDASKPASFFMSDDYWKKGTEITLSAEDGRKVALMGKSKLCNFIVDPHQKIYYIFDPEAPWSFYIELIKILKDEGVEYPRCVKTVGEAPKQKGVSNLGKASTEFDFLDVAVLDDEEEHLEGEEGKPTDEEHSEEEMEEEMDDIGHEEHGDEI